MKTQSLIAKFDKVEEEAVVIKEPLNIKGPIYSEDEEAIEKLKLKIQLLSSAQTRT